MWLSTHQRSVELTSFSIQAGLFSAVLTSFVVPKIQDLEANPAYQSAYYQNQSVQILAQISLQIASIGTQTPFNATQPSPLPAFQPSASDRLVNIFWLLSLVFSLCAALLATLVQQWVRSYMGVFQRSSKPLKTARIRQFLFEGVEPLPAVAGAVPWLIHVSLLLFFVGLGIAILTNNRTVSLVTVIPIAICGTLYLLSVVVPLRNPQSSYRDPFSGLIWNIIRKLRHGPFNTRFRGTGVRPAKMVVHQEQLAMEENDERKARDVRAVQWLVDNINGSNEMDNFVLAIPGSFNQEWGREVWQLVSTQGDSQTDGREVQQLPPTDVNPSRLNPSSPPEITTVGDLCRCVRYLFETYNNEGHSMNKEARRRRIHGCIETAASIVCCTDIRLSQFGEVGEVLSEVGRTEEINKLSTIRSNPSFAIRWTCISLVAFQQMVMVEGNRVRELAGFGVSGIARFQLVYGAPDAAALQGARRIDDYLMTAWERVEDLHRAFEPWDHNRTGEEVRNILGDCEDKISELERITNEANGLDDVDWRISLLQDAMYEATYKLTRQVPGVSFNELKPSGPILITEAFDFPLSGSTPITPQFIFPGQQLQGLFALGRGLREIVEERNPERHPETVKSLESIGKIPVPLRRLKDLMTRQLWRLQDLRDGGGLGFTIELFFLALRQLSSTSSSPELKWVFDTGTFKVITSSWENSTHSSGTQRILLNLICDLVIKSRGVFSDFSYPTYIVDLLLKLVGHMTDGHGNAQPHIKSAIEELRSVNSRDCMDRGSGTKRWGRWGPFNLLTCNGLFALVLQYLRLTDSGLGQLCTQIPTPLSSAPSRNTEPSYFPLWFFFYCSVQDAGGATHSGLQNIRWERMGREDAKTRTQGEHYRAWCGTKGARQMTRAP